MTLILVLFSVQTKGQYNADSLRTELNKFAQPDGKRLKALQAYVNALVRNRSDSAQKFLDEGMQLARKLKDRKTEGYLLINQADIYKRQNKYLEAFSLNQTVYELSDSIKSPELRQTACTNIGVYYHFKKDYAKAKTYFFRSLELMPSLKEPKPATEARIYFNIGLCFDNMGLGDSALLFHEKALKIALRLNSITEIGSNYSGMATVFARQGKYQKAIDYSLKAIPYIEKSGNQVQLVPVWLNIGYSYQLLKKYDASEKAYLKALELAKKVGYSNIQATLLNNLGSLAEESGDYKKATKYMSLYILFNDSLNKAIQAEQNLEMVKEMEARFDLKLKEKDIQLLRQDKEKQVLEIQRQRLFNWGLGGLGLMALALAFVFYRNAQLRKKTNELLKMEKTLEQRIRQRLEKENKSLLEENLKTQFEILKSQVNPHFLFNSLNSLSSLIRLDAERAEQFVEELSSVYRYLLKSNENQLISLREEMDFIQSYVHLLKTRFGEALQFEVELAESLEVRKIPPLTLQLLVENAIKHNIISAQNPLSIKIYQTENHHLRVENNLQRKTQVVISHKVGLSNITQKYEMLGGSPPQIGENESHFWVDLVVV